MEHSAVTSTGMGSTRGFLFDQQHLGVHPTSTEFTGDAETDHPTPNDKKITGLHVLWCRRRRCCERAQCPHLLGRVSMDSSRISTIFYQELSIFMPMRRRCVRGSLQFPLDREELFNFLRIRLL